MSYEGQIAGEIVLEQEPEKSNLIAIHCRIDVRHYASGRSIGMTVRPFWM